MKNSRLLITVALGASLALVSCKKKEKPVDVAPAAQDTPAAKPAQPHPKSEAEMTPEEQVAAKRRAALEKAMAEDQILSDPTGQWATTAKASSRYGNSDGYSPMQATGAPNTETYGDHWNSWASETPDKGIEWLEIGFAKPVNATAIRIRQNFNPGAIVKIELIADSGSRQTVFSGVDETVYEPSTITWFSKAFEKTKDKIVGAKITLATNAVPGWNEIDAVQLVGE